MSEKKIVNYTDQFDNVPVSLETGKLARQATASVLARVGDTAILASIVSRDPLPEGDFFPLRIDYEERYYAGGVIGGTRFSRREGRPNDDAIVSGRLIDHAIRPLFPKDFMNDTQLVLTVFSIDRVNDPALVAFFAASAAFSISGLPFAGPISALRVNQVDGNFSAGFNYELPEADLDLIVSYLENGTKVQAIEAHGHIVPEAKVVEAVRFGAEKSKDIERILKAFAAECNVPIKEYKKGWINKESIAEFKPHVWDSLKEWQSNGIEFRSAEWESKKKSLLEEVSRKLEGTYKSTHVNTLFSEIEKDLIREAVLVNKTRIDGRGFDEIRELSAEIGLISRVHGSGLFNRGLTQSMTMCTLASGQYKQIAQKMENETEKRYLHHYNFPPYSTGEIGQIGGANRRSIGHGILAEKALLAVLPDEQEFPYTIRLVSEILSSNGSTSMAAACGSSLALMDAGVPIKAHVGGIGVGLFVDTYKENLSIDDYVILTDIMGEEDFSGYMDFKLTGTREGMTAIQLELKVQGIPMDILEKIFETSRNARQKVLDVMEKAISEPRKELSQYAPKIRTLTIPKDKIGMVIGSGGSVIKEIIEKSGAEVDISEREHDALVSISGYTPESIETALEHVLSIVTDIEVGNIFDGVVVRIENYGAFVKLNPNKDGLLHVSEISDGFVKDVNDVLKLGDKIRVKVIGTENGKISVSRKALPPAESE